MSQATATAAATGEPVAGLERLGGYLAGAGLCAGPVTARRIGDGHSNLTYLVEDAAGRRVVVRRPPPPPLPPGGHDMHREARVVQALAGSGVPVARILATAAAGEAFGDVPAYVMEYVDGEVVTERTPPGLVTAGGRRGLAEQLVDTLAALHAVDWQAAGLEGFGRPAGSNAHLLKRYERLVADPADGTLPAAFRPVSAWLHASVPEETGATIVHGDFRIGNVMVARGEPATILAVLDWELATLGDPLMDVGYLLATYAVPGEPLHAVAELGRATLEPGYPSRAELAARYAAATGRDVLSLGWFTVLNLYKLAAMYEYSRRRGEDAYYRNPALVACLLDLAQRATGRAPARPPVAPSGTSADGRLTAGRARG
ncbi:phosphotransferase family protein [Paraconexibacter antarcticus]|uniref:Phosphotransferase family protein n=1 Tax=Paraconexibacter antarcticus TaxID=2949664 RepID=A0ABY5DNC2_9ACTN|nr:phosphotransferase family protein [Paraconexibacter antarcticus]UTI62341.1 phosphotransferase family protein [Paraconexibacter antarcticus]